jgi:8-oxo-dGTP pyrophosphatase MutT (NUDIX family)
VNAIEIRRREPMLAPAAAIRPRDAATLILLLREGSEIRVLMGRRSDRHVFMPGAVVFPGGRVERGDARAPAADDLHPEVDARLRLSAPANAAQPRALALAAIRETFEETGLLIGRRSSTSPSGAAERTSVNWSAFLAHGVIATLAPLRLVARAITPPGSVRRYDTRFFAAYADCVAAEVAAPQDELTNVSWLAFAEARQAALPQITRMVLDGLAARLAADPDLAPDGPVPFYALRRGRHWTGAL